MIVENIPKDVRAFVIEHIDSVELLEILLLLRRRASESWTAQRISDELRTNPASVEHRIGKLLKKGLVTVPEGEPVAFKYHPSSPEIEAVVCEVARCYAEKRVSVIELIFSKPQQTIQTFAEAFRFRKD